MRETSFDAAAGLLFFELIFLSFRSMFMALFTFPDEFKMLLKVRLQTHLMMHSPSRVICTAEQTCCCQGS